MRQEGAGISVRLWFIFDLAGGIETSVLTTVWVYRACDARRARL